MLIIDNKFRKPRFWSNKILAKFSDEFFGDIINVSAWNDEDKEGSHYKSYFKNLNSYFISNWKVSDRGSEGIHENELLIDLESKINPKYFRKFNIVFNHTTLEHIFDINSAFKNLCELSNDIVILVVPFLQEMHFNNDFLDYWRFTPFSIIKLFDKNNFNTIYLNYNNEKNTSIYLFAIGQLKSSTKKYKKIKFDPSNKINCLDKNIGSKIIKNNFMKKFFK